MFKSSFLEIFSKVHYTVPLIVFVPINLFLFYKGMTVGETSVFAFLGWCVLGLFVWTLTEYVLHRYLFHYHPNSKFGKQVHFIFHGVHHDYPRDRLRLVMPPIVSLPLAIGFFLLYRSFIPEPGIYAFYGAFLTGYLIYDMFHYAIHHLEVKGKLWNTLKTHHLKHHYVDPNRGYGVSSPIWDLIVDSDFEKTKLGEESVSA